MKKVSILGTDYEIEMLTEEEWCAHPGIDEDFKETCDGMTDLFKKKIYVIDQGDAHTSKVMRHEIIHAFQQESGIFYAFESAGAWNIEAETDWLANQFHKIATVFKELNI